MLVDMAANALALAAVEIVLSLPQVSGALLAIAVVAILVAFANAAQDSERAAKSPLRVRSRLGWAALFGETENYLGNKRFGVDVARPELESIAGIGNKERAGNSGGFAQSAADRQLGGQEMERLGERAEARQRRSASKKKNSYYTPTSGGGRWTE